MITIVILVHNLKEAGEVITDTTNRCVMSLHETATVPFELYLVDNGSRDCPKTYDMLKGYLGVGNIYKQPMSTVVRYDLNTNISKCWNDAIEATRGEQIFLVNNDIVFHRKGWMERTLEDLRSPLHGIVGLSGMSWNGFGFIEGSYFCFNRSLIGDLGGNPRIFDERFAFSCEDVDLCRRVQNSGKIIFHDTSLASYMTHEHHGTLAWVDREGGWQDGTPIQKVTHQSRKLLCEKWGIPTSIND